MPPAKAEDDCTAEELCARASDRRRELAHGEARRLYERALTLDEGISAAHLGLGTLDFRAGLYEAARVHLERAVGRDRPYPGSSAAPASPEAERIASSMRAISWSDKNSN